MPNTKTLITVGAAAGVSMLLVAGIASAQTPTGTTLAEKIAQKFNVDKGQVQKMLDSERTEHQAEPQKRYEERLAQAVKDGKLTEEQKSKLLTKHKELQAQMENNHKALRSARETAEDKTDAERKQLMEQKKTKMDTLRTEVEKWEKDNNIPTGYLMGDSKRFGSGGHGDRGDDHR